MAQVIEIGFGWMLLSVLFGPFLGALAGFNHID